MSLMPMDRDIWGRPILAGSQPPQQQPQGLGGMPTNVVPPGAPAPAQEGFFGGLKAGMGWGPQGMNDPRAAQMGQMFTNLSRIGMGQAPGRSPHEAYQQTLNAKLLRQVRKSQEQRAAAQESRASEKHSADMDPGYDYNQLVEQGLIDPAQTSYEDFRRMGLSDPSSSVQKNFATWLALNPDATEEEKQQAFDNLARAPIRYDLGGGGVGVTGAVSPGTGPTTLVTPEEATGNEANLEGAKTTAERDAGTRADQIDAGIDAVWEAGTQYGNAQMMLTETERFLEMIQDGDIDTGLIPAMLYNVFGIGSEELAALNSETVYQTLQNLGITNLAPVTENEFKKVMLLWADIAKQEKPNEGSLKQAKRRTEALMERMRADALKQANRVRVYDEKAYNDLVTANPFLAELLQQQKTESTGGETGNAITVERDENGKLVIKR